MIAYKYRSGRGLKDSKGCDVFERDIALLSKDTIYIPTVEQLNDPAEALVDDRYVKPALDLLRMLISDDSVDRMNDSLQGFYDKIRTSGIYSLSKQIENELMWAYYSNGHNGYAIIFDTDILSKSFENGKWGGMYEIDVAYSSKLPKFDITTITNKSIQQILSCFVGNKSTAWKHEEEHRLVFDEGGKCLKIDYRAIKGFVFGCRMPDEDVDYVMKTFAGRNLDYYRVVLKERSYKLMRENLDDRYPSMEKYSPNKVKYNIEEILDVDKLVGGVGYKYKCFVEQVLDEVSTEPFVTAISHIVVSEENGFPNILVWVKVKQDGSFRKMRDFVYEVHSDKLIRKK